MAKRKRSKQFKDTSQVIDIEEARRKRQEKRSRQHKKGRLNQRPAPERPVRASVKQARKRRSIIYAAIILAIVAVIGVSIYNIITLKQEQKEILRQQQELQEQKAELKEELEQLSNPEYIEEQGRTQLRLVLPGENIYVPSASDKKKGNGNED
ncbi:septum formation initiator family protein [Anaerovorax odorimutans]|uniref:Septum formation initiator family protein n=1 Tax=Anaerovorax odorimutans TaxID=109327 RepID=A0ABT1RQQ1_9FIRM|nr:septum formation initiator family protein [Anaerovorax odorimutans]MCQ4637518.1 septum formation initiator family protein [Anaerovorax odorimutans]